MTKAHVCNSNDNKNNQKKMNGAFDMFFRW